MNQLDPRQVEIVGKLSAALFNALTDEMKTIDADEYLAAIAVVTVLARLAGRSGPWEEGAAELWQSFTSPGVFATFEALFDEERRRRGS